MPPLAQLLPDLSYSPEEVERGSSATSRSLAVALVLGGALGAFGTGPASIRRREVVAAAAGSIACAALGLLALRSPAPWILAARRRPVDFALACWGGAAASTAFGGGHQTPAYFPAVLLTAVGSGGIANTRGSALPGVGVGIAHLAGCAASRHRGRSLSARGMMVSAAHSVAFPGSGIVGGLAGRLALRGRILSDALAREARARETGAGKAQVDEVAAQIPELSAAVLRVLPRIAARYPESPGVADATAAMETALSTLRGAELRQQLADEVEPLDSWRRLRAQVEGYNLRTTNVRTRLSLELDQRETVGAAVVGTLMDCVSALVQNAANAGAGRERPVEVTVTVRREQRPRRGWTRDSEDMVVMAIEDDAGATEAPDESDWGGGLTHSDRQAQLLGGKLRLAVGTEGLRAAVELPWLASNSRAASRALTFSRQYTEDAERAFRDMSAITLVQALLFTAGRRGFRPRQLAAPLGLWCAGELADRALEGRRRDLVESALGIVGMTMFSGPERPPAGGYASLLTTQVAARGSVPLAVGAALLQTAGALAVAGRRRFESDADGSVADRVFALVCVGAGVGERLGYEAVRRREESLGGEAWRRRMLMDLARPGRDEHHFVWPLRDALGATAWGEFEVSDLGGEYRVARAALVSAQSRLEALMRRGDPLRGLQDQLARLFAPAPVKVHGVRPRVAPPVGGELDAVAYRVALVGLGHQIAEKVWRCLPDDWRSVGRLRELRLDVHPERGRTRIEVLQVPYREGCRDRADTALDAAARLAGGAAEIAGDRFAVYIDSTACW
jgi:two-component sensor histidine kinase